MAVLLETIDITGVVIQDFFDNRISSVAKVAADNSPIIYEKKVTFGNIDLVGNEKTCWLTLGTLKQLLALASIIGGIYTLNYDGLIYSVRFRNEDPPVISGDPMINRSNVTDSDKYNNITIKLMEV